ncbi:hypothetical protein SAMN04487983_100446 [Streptomyces sp. yr375]|uniref:hypothetical protein n=1 Tax=Streptomyces sp. yr375 TaxID=1761906 RepID=UPI0008CD4A71|nr:hypothetical protein [Streptomyces sp. yr375]SEQ27615.1 hypothetical protein SAMN04487983_100446 [Streptomyces sp. yr375]
MDVPRESGVLSAPKSSNGLSENERSSDLRDPWGEEPGGADGKGGEPGEVTVQLDPLKKGRPDGSDAGASDVPVFVDESGRRSRTFRRIGIAVGTACGAYAVLIVATLLSGNAGAPWLPVPVPGAPDDKPAAGKVDSSSAPDDSTTPRPGEPGGLFPGGTGSTASVSGTMSGKPGASAVPGASGSAAASPGAASASARPSASGTARPSTGPTAAVSPPPGPSSPVVAPPASTPPPPASSPATTPDPPAASPSPAGGTTTTVANGPPDPAPAASSSPAA